MSALSYLGASPAPMERVALVSSVDGDLLSRHSLLREHLLLLGWPHGVVDAVAVDGVRCRRFLVGALQRAHGVLDITVDGEGPKTSFEGGGDSNQGRDPSFY